MKIVMIQKMTGVTVLIIAIMFMVMKNLKQVRKTSCLHLAQMIRVSPICVLYGNISIHSMLRRKS